MNKQQQINMLVAILHSGKGNELQAQAIERQMRLPRGNTSEAVRILIKEAVTKYNIPIGSNANGFYLIDNEAELLEVIAGLQKRAIAIQQRMNALMLSFSLKQKADEEGRAWPNVDMQMTVN